MTAATKTKTKVRKQQHHVWCSFVDDPAETCLHCEILNRDYPFQPGEDELAAAERYFPQPVRAKTPEPAKDLVLVKRGREIAPIEELEPQEPVAWIDTLEKPKSLTMEGYAYQIPLHRVDPASRIAEEIERIELVRVTKTKITRTRTDYHIIETDGHKREVRKVKTTSSKMEKSGKLPRDLSNYVQLFAHLVANGMGAATDDAHDSTNRLTASYEASGGMTFGSRTPSDRVLTGMNAYQMMRQRVPQELLSLFDQIVNEEVAGYSPLSRTLVELGEALGYTHRQSTASGGTQVWCVATLIAHFLRENGIYTRKVRKLEDA